MDEFILKNERFRPTKVESESHLENLIIENRDTIFPYAFIFDYKRQAKTRTTDAVTTADMCLVSHDCSKWWIIEVERSKGASYTFDTIQPQIAIQADADWNKSSHHAIKKLEEEFGVDSNLAQNIKTVDPGFILIYDDIDENIAEIAEEHMFKKIILKPYLSDMGNYALVTVLQEISPGPPEKNSYRVDSNSTKISGGKIWIPVSSRLKKRIGKKRLNVLIDDSIYSVSIQMNDMIKIPISENKESQTSRLVYKRLNYLFDVEEEPNNLQLIFREERKWNNDRR